MNYDAIILELKPVIIQALQNLGEEKIDMNITAVKKVTNSIVSDYFRGTDNSIVNNSLMNIGLYSQITDFSIRMHTKEYWCFNWQ